MLVISLFPRGCTAMNAVSTVSINCGVLGTRRAPKSKNHLEDMLFWWRHSQPYMSLRRDPAVVNFTGRQLKPPYLYDIIGIVVELIDTNVLLFAPEFMGSATKCGLLQMNTAIFEHSCQRCAQSSGPSILCSGSVKSVVRLVHIVWKVWKILVHAYSFLDGIQQISQELAHVETSRYILPMRDTKTFYTELPW